MDIICSIYLIISFLVSVKANSPYIEIVISPIVRNDIIGEIRVIWESKRFTLGDRLTLYRSGDVIFEYEMQTCSGFIDTGSFIDDTNFTQSATTYCTIYSAGYTHNNKTAAYACLQNSPTWMNDLKSQIENFTLTELFIPGTHDSASYVVSRTGYTENILQKYVYTQDVSVYEQLIMGVRYLDLRIGFYNHTLGDPPFFWWCNHDFMPVIPLGSILKQIRDFVTSTNEIIIVDFHYFPVGFSDSEIHKRLAKYIVKEIGDLLHKRTDSDYHIRLGSIWNSGKRIILAYSKEDIGELFSFYKPIKQYWGNKQTLPDLFTYLSGLVDNCEGTRPYMWASMAQLTPSTLGVLTDWYGGLRNLANKVNTNLTFSYRSCTDWSLCTNIVAVDFFRSTGIISTAVMINRARAKNHDNRIKG